MSDSKEEKDSKKEKTASGSPLKKPAVIIGICAAVVVAGAVGLYAAGVIGGPKEEEKPDSLRFATEGVVLLDTDYGIYDELEPNSIALEFQNDAFSYDGQNFECYLGNSGMNKYNMFITLYEDTTLEDDKILYISGLVPPGSRFEEITLDKTLPVGHHQLVVAFTQVEDDNITAHAQTLYTMDFHVFEKAK